MESIDALAKAVNEFEGGMVLVSHDMRLISQVAKEIWICDDKTITRYRGDIQSFKMDMRDQMGLNDTNDKVKLRGDASVRKKEGDVKAIKPPPPNKKEAKLEVLVPSKVAVVEDDAATTATAGTMISSDTVASVTAPTPQAPAPAPPAVPVQRRYIPPHLRKKMQEASSS
jgi:energy-coupling factor transporter ATP-binding protein EcfA2